jgi:hypothetical protein
MSGVVLGPDYRRRLRQFQAEHGRRLRCRIGWPELKLAMSAPFSWQTLQSAGLGKSVSESTRNFIVQWLDRYYPEQPGAPAARDYKSAAANDDQETTRTVRGSR